MDVWYIRRCTPGSAVKTLSSLLPVQSHLYIPALYVSAPGTAEPSGLEEELRAQAAGRGRLAGRLGPPCWAPVAAPRTSLPVSSHPCPPFTDSPATSFPAASGASCSSQTEVASSVGGLTAWQPLLRCHRDWASPETAREDMSLQPALAGGESVPDSTGINEFPRSRVLSLYTVVPPLRPRLGTSLSRGSL